MESTSSGHDGHHHFGGTHYVVSEDVDILVNRWCSSINLLSPSEDLYLELRSKMSGFLQDIFAKVTFIGSREIRDGLLESVRKQRQAGFTVISLERAYLEDSEIDGRIEITRKVDDWGEDIVIHGERNGTSRKILQFERLHGKKNLVLVDDVVFSGKTIINTINDLHYHQANVHSVVSAVGVKAGVDRLKKVTFGVSGMPDHLAVDCLEEFDDISDQVCERDFYPGVPYSGREHCGCDKAAFPYILPFGKPGKWASIPEKEVRQFSALCLENTMALFREVEKINGIKISCSMLPRPIFGFPRDDRRFVDLLQQKHADCLSM